MNYYQEPARKLPIREFDVVVAGGGTAGVVAALAAARRGSEDPLARLPADLVREDLQPFFGSSDNRHLSPTMPDWIPRRHGSTSWRLACLPSRAPTRSPCQHSSVPLHSPDLSPNAPTRERTSSVSTPSLPRRA